MKWYKRTDPANPNRFYYSKNNRPEYTEEDIMHGAYGLRLGNDGRWNEILSLSQLPIAKDSPIDS